MQITEVTVSAGRTFNDPNEKYANHKPTVTLTATLAPWDDVAEVTRRLQRDAELLVEHHKRAIVQNLRAEYAQLELTKGT